MSGADIIIGVDFDNTVVCYDGLFHRVAVDEGLIPDHLSASKTAVRNHLRACGREEDWTRLQGLVYGPRMANASPFPGVFEFFALCRERGVATAIISHRTRHPYLGPRYDLHQFACRWLEDHWTGEPLQTFFELTKRDKLNRIAAERCTHFVDDLPEFLGERGFPRGVRKLLFDPGGAHAAESRFVVVPSWSELREILLP